jgi:exodeoxyribonuclease VII small subunit
VLCRSREFAFVHPTFLDWTIPAICSRFYRVPNVSRNAGQNNPAKADTLPFEEALKKLEAIVEAMESEELPLESLLGKYEQGTRLAKICQDKLAEAELKIQQLEKGAAGELKLKPLVAAENTKETE